jgi:hypothetical protein
MSHRDAGILKKMAAELLLISLSLYAECIT